MSRASVATVAVRAVSLWLIASGIGSGASVLFVRIPPELPDVRMQTVLLFSVLPVAMGLLLWSLGPAIARRVFPGPEGQSSPDTVDLHRVASVFTGLGLVSWGALRAISLLGASVWRFRPGGGLFGGTATPLDAFEFQAGALHTAIQLGFGALLLFKPSVVEGALRMWSAPSETPHLPDTGHGD